MKVTLGYVSSPLTIDDTFSSLTYKKFRNHNDYIDAKEFIIFLEN